jgi:hypothetical protein
MAYLRDLDRLQEVTVSKAARSRFAHANTDHHQPRLQGGWHRPAQEHPQRQSLKSAPARHLRRQQP